MLPSIFESWFTFSSTSHDYGKHYMETLYGKWAFISMSIKTWTDIQKQIKGVNLNSYSLTRIKLFLTEFFSNSYSTNMLENYCLI